ncbi:ankyrin repeat domain-containing protein [Jiangella ureilytica]|uniref:Ankyrin repeat domain-containing protein n=1 Tax=Jiangella ureilytica TaxID=2530374 RepID=A0A4R4RJ22_9ACTN|nr:ankyrin repeat domain-containing protein [Jiangella ureilytica]TDC49430.1 ankyrin repeat domain-containing protein [Jiangella ureilytica]
MRTEVSMPELPAHPDLAHLKKQAKELLRRLRDDEPGARLSDAQFRLAREYGFPSWPALRRHVEELRGPTVLDWLRLVYAGGTIGGTHAARPSEAARWIGRIDLSDPYLACAVGDVDGVSSAVAADPGWVHRPGGPLGLPPLVAVTHSSLVRLPEFAPGLRECARVLLDAGADPNQAATSPGGHPLSALYGAAGVTHDRELTALLLERGADPDDDESLYHSLGDVGCVRLLLAAGATVTGTNAMYAVADHDDADVLRLLLEHGGDANEPSPSWGSPLLFALRRRCSTAFVRLLLDAGADPRVVSPDGVGAHRLALRFGLTEAAALLPGSETDDPAEQLIAASTSGDGDTARRLLADHPGLIAALDDAQRRLLPDLAAGGAADAVRLLVEAGWPIDTPGGDWHATALNHAVFRGDAGLTRFLLEHGADPAVRHGFGDTVVGTLSWASLNNEEVGIVADWAGCAQALRDHGVVLPDDDEFGDGVR